MRSGGRRLLIAAVVVACVARARFDWIPVWYLAAFVGVPAAGSWAVRGRAHDPRRRAAVATAAAVAMVALFPVPWMVAADGLSPGTAWRLDGRVMIDGVSIDPDGDWLWLTAGRPPTVAELVWSKLAGRDTTSTMRAGPMRKRARWSEPAAAAVGLNRGGWDVGTRLEAHVAEPLVPGLPRQAVVVGLNGTSFANAAEWFLALESLEGRNTLTTATGDTYEFHGREFPYAEIDSVVSPTRTIDVVVGGRMATTPVGKWWRNLATGSSHGLMVALVAYVHASGDEIGRGLTVAGTGSIRPDGSVGRIGGLWAKATAARDAGADVLVYPAIQTADLAGFDSGAMALVPVVTLDHAITALQYRRSL